MKTYFSVLILNLEIALLVHIIRGASLREESISDDGSLKKDGGKLSGDFLPSLHSLELPDEMISTSSNKRQNLKTTERSRKKHRPFSTSKFFSSNPTQSVSQNLLESRKDGMLKLSTLNHHIDTTQLSPTEELNFFISASNENRRKSETSQILDHQMEMSPSREKSQLKLSVQTISNTSPPLILPDTNQNREIKSSGKEEIRRSDNEMAIEAFEGSGDIHLEEMDISGGEGSKTARVIDLFSRNNGTAECTTPKGEDGHCQRIIDCPLRDAINNYSLFLQHLCLMNRIFVGICCPDNPVVEISDSDDNSTEVSLDIQQPPQGCGIAHNTRIVGGTMSLPHQWTWMVALLRRNRFYCGGVIINDWYILTAAHCVLGINVKDLKIRLGEYNFNERNEHQRDIPVAEIKRHAMFVTLTFQHDIALLKLKRKVEYSKFIGSICLPESRNARNYTDVNATVVGWGTVSFGGAASPVLRQVTIPVWDNEDCDRTYLLENINESFLCAGAPENGEDACQGDSGGPLMTLNPEGRWEVIGIVSWGRRCGDPTYPGVYTRVTSYLDWIAENSQ